MSTCRGRLNRRLRIAADSCILAGAGNRPAQSRSDRAALSSEVPFLLFALHRAGTIVVDDPAATLGEPALHGLANDLGEGCGRAFERAGQGIAAQRTEPHSLDFGAFTRCQR